MKYLIILLINKAFGAVAQLGERVVRKAFLFHVKQWVTGFPATHRPLIFLSLLLLSLPALACDKPDALAIHIGSEHLQTDEDYNEENPGLGIRCGKWEGGVYKNSLSRTTIYAGVRKAWGWLGLRGGLATGYRHDIIPYVAPFATMGPLEFTYIPKYKDSAAAVGLSVVVPLQ